MSEELSVSSRIALGVDGLPCSFDSLEKKVRDLELRYRRELRQAEDLFERGTAPGSIGSKTERARTNRHPNSNQCVSKYELPCAIHVLCCVILRLLLLY